MFCKRKVFLKFINIHRKTPVSEFVFKKNSLKTKTTQSILPDPESAKQHMRGGNLQYYQYKHSTDRWLTQIDPCTSGWTRSTDGELVP